ncbi:MAG: hypothetical protein WAW96_08740 [Alphaproteobacteria bacterium]
MAGFGSLDHERQLARVPRVEDLASESALCQAVETLVFAIEISRDAGIETIPKALNPVLPPYVRFELHHHSESPWGPFSTATMMIAARANGAALAFATGGFCDNDQVAEHFRLHYGVRFKRGSISIERRYSGMEGRVASEGRLVLDAIIEKAEPVDRAQVLMPPLLNLAKFEGQLWLIEEDRNFAIETAERGMTLIRKCEPDAFGEERIQLRHTLPALYTKSSLTYLPVAALVDPGLPAYLGTRAINPSV